MRDRTADLLRAKQALSQLSYSPRTMVGLGRFELPTSPLSGVRSNQLSYRPNVTRLPRCPFIRRTPRAVGADALPCQFRRLRHKTVDSELRGTLSVTLEPPSHQPLR